MLEGTEDEQFDPLKASELARLLRGHQLPLVLLDACQSGKLSGEIETSLGNRLMQAGVLFHLQAFENNKIISKMVDVRKLFDHDRSDAGA